MHIHPKFNSQSYFIRQITSLRKFSNTSFLKNTAYIAQW